MGKASEEKRGLVRRWREKLKQRNGRARGISHRVGTARREMRDHRPGGGGDGPAPGGGF